jgi:hypothetical protein
MTDTTIHEFKNRPHEVFTRSQFLSYRKKLTSMKTWLYDPFRFLR